MSVMDSEEITVSFFTTLDSAESVVRSLDGRQTGISSRNVLVSASIVPPLPAQDEWETAFHCHSEEDFSSLLPGCRPDTVVLSDIPIRWFGLKTPQLEKGSSSLRNLNAFFSHYGAVESVLFLLLTHREIQLLSSSEIDSFLCTTTTGTTYLFHFSNTRRHPLTPLRPEALNSFSVTHLPVSFSAKDEALLPAPVRTAFWISTTRTVAMEEGAEEVACQDVLFWLRDGSLWMRHLTEELEDHCVFDRLQQAVFSNRRDAPTVHLSYIFPDYLLFFTHNSHTVRPSHTHHPQAWFPSRPSPVASAHPAPHRRAGLRLLLEESLLLLPAGPHPRARRLTPRHLRLLVPPPSRRPSLLTAEYRRGRGAHNEPAAKPLWRERLARVPPALRAE